MNHDRRTHRHSIYPLLKNHLRYKYMDFHHLYGVFLYFSMQAARQHWTSPPFCISPSFRLRIYQNPLPVEITPRTYTRCSASGSSMSWRRARVTFLCGSCGCLFSWGAWGGLSGRASITSTIRYSSGGGESWPSLRAAVLTSHLKKMERIQNWHLVGPFFFFFTNHVPILLLIFWNFVFFCSLGPAFIPESTKGTAEDVTWCVMRHVLFRSLF